jgi:nitrite reductase/ring-hydroxylating ferredoxin subunit
MSEQGLNAVRLCHLDELVVGAARGFDPQHTGKDTMFVLRRDEGVRAYFNRCPHQSAPLEYRKDRFLSADGTRVICHGHGAHFDPDTGVCLHGACLGQSLEQVPCRIEYGWIWIWLRDTGQER